MILHLRYHLIKDLTFRGLKESIAGNSEVGNIRGYHPLPRDVTVLDLEKIVQYIYTGDCQVENIFNPNVSN